MHNSVLYTSEPAMPICVPQENLEEALWNQVREDKMRLELFCSQVIHTQLFTPQNDIQWVWMSPPFKILKNDSWKIVYLVKEINH